MREWVLKLKYFQYCLMPTAQLKAMDPTAGLHVSTKSKYILLGYYINDDLSTHAVYSDGSDTLGTSAKDVAVGLSYVNKNMTYTLEYHKGSGTEWMKYFTPDNNWRSFVGTITYKF